MGRPMNDAVFYDRFLAGQFAPEEWKHREHIKAAYLCLRRYPLTDATAQMRRGLAALNASHKAPNEIDRGYHETMTVAWMRVVDVTMGVFGVESDSDTFCDKHPHLMQKTLMRLFYSKERIMTWDAKQRFVEPDLALLPRAPERS